MKASFGVSQVLAIVISMMLFGCEREQPSGLGTGPSSGVAASGGTATSAVAAFDLGGIFPGDSNATLDVTNGATDPSADETFSIEDGFASGNEDEVFVYWYINWTLPNATSDASDPIFSGQGLHTLDNITLAHKVCDLGIQDDEFELWVVASNDEWNSLDAAKWTLQSVLMHWNWFIKWYPDQCEELPPLPVVEEELEDTGTEAGGDGEEVENREEVSDEAESSEGGDEVDEAGDEAGDEADDEADDEANEADDAAGDDPTDEEAEEGAEG